MSGDAARPADGSTQAVTTALARLDLVRLAAGAAAPAGADQVRVERYSAGGYIFSGSIGIHADDVVAGSATAITGALGPDGPFPTLAAAEAAAVEWAAEQGAETLYLVTAA